MKLAISNIAWQQHDDIEILSGLRERGVRGIEVAPTKIWPEWKGVSAKGAALYRKKILNEGFEIPAMQAILFGRQNLQVFDKSSHIDFFNHIKMMSDIAATLGVKVLVFGAPKNRLRGQLSTYEAMNYAADFFREVAEICYAHDCCIGLEHNPVEYGCDFVTNVADAKELVNKVNHPGFQLHLDSAGIHMCGSDIAEIIKCAQEFAHFHVSEPMLEPVSSGEVNHELMAETLNAVGYEGWVSIEMKLVENLEVLYQSVEKTASCYVS